MAYCGESGCFPKRAFCDARLTVSLYFLHEFLYLRQLREAILIVAPKCKRLHLFFWSGTQLNMRDWPRQSADEIESGMFSHKMARL